MLVTSHLFAFLGTPMLGMSLPKLATQTLIDPLLENPKVFSGTYDKCVIHEADNACSSE